MSDTPRTDAEYERLRSIYESWASIQKMCCPFENDMRLARQLERELNSAQSENTRLRAALAASKSPCVYCSLPAEEWSKCKQGFPGCGRMDDAMGCPELGASMALEELKEQANALVAAGDNLSVGIDSVLSATDILELKTNWRHARAAFTNPI